MKLKQSCSTCREFDGDVHCSLRRPDALVVGVIVDPERVVCEKHEVREAEQQRAEIEKAEAIEGIAYENKLSQASGRY